MSRWNSSVYLKNTLLFLSLHNAQALAAQITFHFNSYDCNIALPTISHTCRMFCTPCQAILYCIISPLQKLTTYTQSHKIWSCVSTISCWHKCHPVPTLQPLYIRTFWVKIFLSSISQMKILTFNGTLILHRLFWYESKIPLLWSALYAEEQEIILVDDHPHILLAPTWSTEHL